jgi:hypothetical protein
MANISATRIATTDRASTSLPDASDLLVEGRTELKYSVPGPIADTALQIARGYLRPDTSALGPQQLVTSLYLDTAHLTFLRWHHERAVDRFKLRIRRYGDDAAPALYAEVKRKTGSVVRKHRAPFPADALHAVLNASVDQVLPLSPGPTGRVLPPSPLASVDRRDGPSERTVQPALDRRVAERPDLGGGGSDPALDRFIRYRSRYAAMPMMLVTCVRESLRDPKDGTAVTVDRDLRYQSTSRGDLIGEGGAWRSIPLPDSSGSATALLEVKYSLDPEPWMGTLIEQLAPWRVSFSKYATAMTASAAC